MERRSHNLVFSGLIALAVGAVAVIGYLAVSTPPGPGGTEIPGTPIEGLADHDDASLGLEPSTDEASATERPVLQVADPGAEAPAGTPSGTESAAEPTAGEATAAAPSSTTSMVPAAPSSTVATTAATSPASTAPASSTTAPATTMGTVPEGHEWLSAVEWEIVRLTNELRTNPNGPLAREGAVTDCDGRIPLDPATGGYQAAGALTVDRVASVDVARPWSAQLTTELIHRPQAGITALQDAGVAVMAAGENIAYHNFPDTAYRHFAGWRESDGHFCNMMDPGFTHIGIGEHTDAEGFSFATQNFFSLQPTG